MEIKLEDILITQKNMSLITQKELQEDSELARRFIEASLSTLEMKFGQFSSIEIRRDIEEGLTTNFIKELGGNKTESAFAHIINANTDKNYKIVILISAQRHEIQCEKINFIDRIKNIFKGK